MSAEQPAQVLPLEGDSPYDLRVNQSHNVSESAIKHALATGDMGFIHSFTTGSTVDGPGVRVVAWTAGCQWRCMYCHNPDTWNMMNGMPVTLDRAIEGLNKYRHGLKMMGGGLTVSGGDPLMQDRFVLKLCRAARLMGIHTCIETNGYLGERLDEHDLDAFDLIMLGLKSWGANHKKVTGKEIGPTLEFAKRLAHRKQPIWVRFVLVPGLTDNDADIRSIAQFAASLGNVQRVEVLPFHQLGRFKWERLGIDYALENVKAPSPEAIERACEIFKAEGLQAL